MIEIAWLIVAGIGAIGLMICFSIAMGKMIKFGDGE